MGKDSKICVEIDKQSGFCFGVVNAISQAEEELSSGEPLYCLGDIVHNNEEVERLKKKGLVTISHSDLDSLKGKKVLLRAHGEPPETYKKSLERNISIVDASCPVVLKLQVKVREGMERVQRMGGQVVIYGKKGHAEVVGLLGQTNYNAIVVENFNDIESLDFSKPIELFAQTTMSADGYRSLVDEIQKRIKITLKENPAHFKVHNSICGQVANRKKELIRFSKKHDAIVFVGGGNSSNGKMLFQACKATNPTTHFISSAKEIQNQWFVNIKSVGICGATSTPLWLMEEVAKRIEGLNEI